MYRLRSDWSARAASAFAALLLVGALQVASSTGLISPHTIPAPVDIAASIPRLILTEGAFDKFLLTLAITLTATAIAIVIGTTVGWALFRWQLLGAAFEGWFGAAFSAPLVLMYPLFLVVFGRGIATILIMASIAGIIPIVLSTLQGLRAVPQVYLSVARSIKMTDVQIAYKVMLPAALPVVFTGIRLGLIYIIIYIVALEYMVGIGGLGALVGLQYDRYDIPGTFAAIVFVLFVTILIFVFGERVERWWKFR